MKNKLTLLVGIQKSGTNWARFCIFNYFNILNNNAKKTLTWDELKDIHLSRGFYPNNQDPNIPNNLKAFNDGLPMVYFSHIGFDGTGFIKNIPSVKEWYDKFDNVILAIRNPYDTMISYHKFLFNRDKVPYMNIQDRVDMTKMRDLHSFTEYYLEKWISHRKATLPIADVVLDYDELRKNPAGFIDAIELIAGDVDLAVLERAIKMSSFDNIKSMSDEVKQPWGVGGPLYKGYFCRDGRTGQYHEVMEVRTIKYIKKRCKKEGIEIE